ncbi:hypothetical protein [Soonwooa sp.]|uniref:HYC_CC_PP family protein n=1 Tax=Soonwooa sp. TaxID=1938592 RepID=UPI0026132E98|nr:hypothetical protein [Soonwooa sp.]
MKKILAIVFSVFYFGLSSGAVFSVHYCMNELASINQTLDEACGKCGTKSKNDCCKTEFKVLKTDTSQKSELLQLSFISSIAEVVTHHFEFPDISFSDSKFSSIQINAPPESWSVPIFIQHCNFRI